MPYLNSDDGMPDNPKVDGLSDGAFRLYVSAMHYCARELTNGIVPAHRLPRLTPRYRPAHLRELLDARLAHEGGTGCDTATCVKGEPGAYVVHDFLEWNRSREWWERKRRRTAERVAKWRAEHLDERQEKRHA